MKLEELISNKRIPASNKDVNSSIEASYDSDYRRIIKSSSFRRLQDKTQVFPLERSDFVRTRLTHSLEVAMLSRDILSQVISELNYRKIDTTRLSMAYRLLESAALIHDIGNPPFGHFGESAIRIWFERNQQNYSEITTLSLQQLNDFIYFDGNAQSLRVITKLHDYNGTSSVGMRLTASVMDSVIKYSANSTELSKERLITKKVGYFYSERELFQEIKNTTGSNKNRHPLVYLIEAADDISYTFSDIEDGYKYNMFSVQDFQLFLNDPNLDERFFHQSWTEEEKIQKLLFEMQRSVYLAISKVFADNFTAILDGKFETDLFIGDLHEIVLFKRLKQFCNDYIFNSKTILNQEIMGFNIINRLLSEFVPVVLKYDSDKKMNAYEEKLIRFLPESITKRYHLETEKVTHEEDKNYYRLRMCVDYVSGMTDGFAKKVYEELFRY